MGEQINIELQKQFKNLFTENPSNSTVKWNQICKALTKNQSFGDMICGYNGISLGLISTITYNTHYNNVDPFPFNVNIVI